MDTGLQAHILLSVHKDSSGCWACRMSKAHVALAPPPSQLIWAALADAEREVMKLRRLLVVNLCNCRRMSTTLPLEPVMHSATCEYRRAMS